MLAHTRSFLRIALVLAFPLLGVLPARGQANLSFTGGALGKTTTFALSGTPGEVYVLILSTTQGPTTLGGATLNVGMDLADWTLAFPGWVGVLSGGGTAQATLLLPNIPFLDGMDFFGQFVTLLPGQPLVDEVSNWIRISYAAPETFDLTAGSLGEARALHTANLLPDGRVLLAGGGSGSQSNPQSTNTAEIYDPMQEATVMLGATLLTARALHAGVTLADGRVLLIGGVDVNGNVTASCEIYDPATSAFLSAASMSRPRVGHTATLLDDGRVLVCGGTDVINDPLQAILDAEKSAEIYNPASNTWAGAPNMADERFGHAAVKLADGRVLVSGGASVDFILFIPLPYLSDETQVYNPQNNSWSGVTTMRDVRVGHTMVLLSSGKVLIAGGANGIVLDPSSTNTAEIYNPQGGSFSWTGSLQDSRALAPAVRLADGRVLIAGGGQGSLSSGTGLATAELYDPAAGTFAFTDAMSVDRTGHTLVPTPDGTALVMGGGSSSGSTLASGETYTP